MATFRITQYELKDDASGFTGTTFTLSLRQDLAEHYFVLIESGGCWDGVDGTPPNANFCGMSKDPFGTGSLGTTTNPDEIELERGAATNTWRGVVTIVECVGDHDASGFRLRHIGRQTTTSGGTSFSHSIPSGSEWGDIDQVAVYGGDGGGGAGGASNSSAGYQTVSARIWPAAGTPDTIELRRDLTAAVNGITIFSFFVVEWGSEWNIQRASISTASANGGNGVDITGEYNTATITSVTRANAWVYANGTTSQNGIGDAWFANVYTLGDGVNQNATETKVAVANEFSGNDLKAEIYVHEHAGAAVDFRFGIDGTTGVPTGNTTGTLTVDSPAETESYGSVGSYLDYTEGAERFCLWTNTSSGTGTTYPRPLISARHTASGTVTWVRSRSGSNGAAWLQSIDLSAIGRVLAPGAAAATVTALSPTISQERILAPAAAQVTASAPAATIDQARPIAPGAAAVTVTALSPTIEQERVLAPPAAAITASAPAASIAQERILAPPTASVIATAQAPTIEQSRILQPAAAALVAAALSPSIAQERVLSPPAASATVTSQSPTIEQARSLQPAAAAVIASAPTPSVSQNRPLAPGAAAVTVSAMSPSVSFERFLSPEAAAISVTAPSASIIQSRSVQPVPAAVVVTALQPSIQQERVLQPAAAVVGVSALAPTIEQERTLLPTAAEITVTVPAPILGRGWQYMFVVPPVVRVQAMPATMIVGGDEIELPLPISRSAAQRLDVLRVIDLRLPIMRTASKSLDILRQVDRAGQIGRVLRYELER